MSSCRVIVMILHTCTHWWSFIIIILLFFLKQMNIVYPLRHRTLSVGILDGKKDITMCACNGINNS